MNEEQLSALIDHLVADLREALPPEALPRMVLYRAACERLVEYWQPDDRNELRYATSHLALQALGVTDAAVERAKVQLTTGCDFDTLNRRQ